MMRWPLRHGQSNAIHFGRDVVTTTTAVFLGSFSGISSADSTSPMQCTGWRVSH
ncbi:hypothetical protein [Bradyrhizobium elkanii]|uniref:hypothetical protein n=1 Tax=Bradyrhizobium elkanii TaxID=29448 RepID=UPI0021680742|nr:hypothetical protein [Bradyrhizobium elkanii]MCS3695014.1 hypothetical protein [Bradyrhizobium elkanii]